MIYTLFLYQNRSGLLLFEKNFQDVSNGKSDMFGSFFAALKSFISEMILEGEKELRDIEMADYVIIIKSISEVNSDVVIIADKKDNRIIHKLLPKITQIILDHKELFIDWKADVSEFMILNQPLTELILSRRQLFQGSPLINDQSQVLESIWEHRKDFPDEIRENLIKEKNILIRRLKRIKIFQKELAIVEKLVEISEKLKDQEEYIKYQEQANFVRRNIEDKKYKLNYYLKNIKKSLEYVIDNIGNKNLKEGDFKYVFLYLFSFSSMLESLASFQQSKKYKEMARFLINSEELSYKDFSKIINNILTMSDDVEEYIFS